MGHRRIYVSFASPSKSIWRAADRKTVLLLASSKDVVQIIGQQLSYALPSWPLLSLVDKLAVARENQPPAIVASCSCWFHLYTKQFNQQDEWKQFPEFGKKEWLLSLVGLHIKRCWPSCFSLRVLTDAGRSSLVLTEIVAK